VTTEEKIERILEEKANEASVEIFNMTGLNASGVVVMAAIRDGRTNLNIRSRCARCHGLLEQAMMMDWVMDPEDDEFEVDLADDDEEG
jgi:hypothetical protein